MNADGRHQRRLLQLEVDDGAASFVSLRLTALPLVFLVRKRTAIVDVQRNAVVFPLSLLVTADTVDDVGVQH
ncbi:MAG: hypothetical protein AAGA48_06655 [Myxococcota bacterium]